MAMAETFVTLLVLARQVWRCISLPDAPKRAYQ